jgi:hypothetical protein
MDKNEKHSFDCVYSISVLEHIPEDAVTRVCDGIRQFARQDGSCSIHAMDHVLLGNGAAEHGAKLSQFAAAFGVPAVELATVVEQLEQDPDAYFLSAEAHNRWRASTPYDEFPMRRCVSVHFCVGSPFIAAS